MENKSNVIETAFNDVITYYTTTQANVLTQIQRKTMTTDILYDGVRKFLRPRNLSEEEMNAVLRKVDDFLFGYYKLTPLLNDPDVSDIRCHGPNNIRVKKFGKRYATNIKFDSEEEYMNFIQSVAIKNQTDISMVNAQTTFMDIFSHPDFRLRFDISTKLLNSSRLHTMHIRKLPKKKRTFRDLMNAKPVGMMDEDVANFLTNQIKANQSMIISGHNAAGKSQLLNAAIEEYPHGLSGLCTQENEELFSDTHPDIFFQHVLTPNGEGKVKYDLKDEIRYGLISDNNLFIVGEIKDEAALYAINAAYTGSACWLTVHSENSQEAVQKLADYAMYESKYSIDKIYKELSYMHMVIHVESFQIKEISMITGYDEESQKLKYDLVYSQERGIKNFDGYYLRPVETANETLIYDA